jgi:hypothetical protein
MVQKVGSRAMVYHGNAHHTSGGLTKKDLIKNKHGRIVSKKKYLTAKKEKRLAKHGYRTRKGKFGSFKKTAKKGGGDGWAKYVTMQKAAFESVSG